MEWNQINQQTQAQSQNLFSWYFIGSWWTVPGKVDVDYKCDLCSVSGNIQECFRSHGVKYQENYAEGEILETFAPALPI